MLAPAFSGNQKDTRLDSDRSELRRHSTAYGECRQSPRCVLLSVGAEGLSRNGSILRRQSTQRRVPAVAPRLPFRSSAACVSISPIPAMTFDSWRLPCRRIPAAWTLSHLGFFVIISPSLAFSLFTAAPIPAAGHCSLVQLVVVGHPFPDNDRVIFCAIF